MNEVNLPDHLERIDPDEFYIKRIKWGRGYRFLNLEDRPIESKEVLDVVSTIRVPDTWSEVTLSHLPNSYILARGFDGSEKLQYLYHPDFLAFRNNEKFTHLFDFGKALPRMRRRIRQHIHHEEWNEQKLLALILRILDKYHMRIGSRVYAHKNQSFGLTTLRKKHLKEDEGHSYHFEYLGKSGQKRTLALNDPQLVRLIEEISDFPGWELFSLSTKHGRISADSVKVNHYIQQISGANFTARNFRTWGGTVLAVKYAGRARKIVAENPKRKLGTVLVELVAEKLGNTPSICKEYYIHPGVLEAVVEENFDATPCKPEYTRNTLYRKHECRTLEILSKLSGG